MRISKDRDTVVSLFETQVKQYPAMIAASFGNKSITYSELNQRSTQFAHCLKNIGVQAETRVAICLARSIDFLIAIMGVLKAGGAYIPLDPAQPEKRLLLILNNSETHFLVTEQQVAVKFKQYVGQVISLNDHSAEQSTADLDVAIKPNQLAYIIYTSGSTGEPKGVLIEHQSIVNYAQWFANYSATKPQQRIDWSSNVAFDMAITSSLVPLMLGLTIVIAPDELRKNVSSYLHYLQEQAIEIIKLTPSYFKILVQEVIENYIELPHLQTIILGGEQLHAQECKTWLHYYPHQHLFNEYGPTEITVAATQYLVSKKNCEGLLEDVPIGFAGEHMQCMVLNENQQPVALGEVGELYIGGLGVARGYLNQPELTDKFFILHAESKQRLYKTGDLCRYLLDGSLVYIGRIDEQIKIRGFRVELAEIERHLRAHSAVKDAVVFVQDQLPTEKRLVAYYQTNTSCSPQALRQHLQINIPEYMLPSLLVEVDDFPLTANGKLDHAALLRQNPGVSSTVTLPQSDIELKLAAIWQDELNMSAVGIHDGFYELGGHSLIAARIVSRINKAFAKNITFGDFDQADTIAKLVILLESKKQTKQALQYKYQQKRLPLSDFQLILWLSHCFESKVKKLNVLSRKRVQGILDKSQLEHVFKQILKKHEILSYRIFKYYPTQAFQKNLKFKLITTDHRTITRDVVETILYNSYCELMAYDQWNAKQPLIVARLFYLSDERSELQICLPHFIADEISTELLFKELSQHYLNQAPPVSEKPCIFKDYLFEEQQQIKAYLAYDMNFWENYLKDAHLFEFPEKHLLYNMKNTHYSTYVPVSEKHLAEFAPFCASHHVNVNDVTCAALIMALVKTCPDYQKKAKNVLINIVRTTRNEEAYDKVLGCFVRVDPIKVSVQGELNLIELSKRIHQAVMENAPYQQRSTLMKFAFISSLRQKSMIGSWLGALAMPLFRHALRLLKLDYPPLKICHRFIAFRHQKNFIIIVNVWNNFLQKQDERRAELFGFRQETLPVYRHDLSTMNNILDVCFMREHQQDQPHVVISANLSPIFRQKLANELVASLPANEVIIASQES